MSHKVTQLKKLKLRKEDPKKYVELSQDSMAKHVELMLEFQNKVLLRLIMVTISVKLHITTV